MKSKKLNVGVLPLSLSLTILIGLMAMTLTACSNASGTVQTTSSAVESTATAKITFDTCSGSDVLTEEIGKDGTNRCLQIPHGKATILLQAGIPTRTTPPSS